MKTEQVGKDLGRNVKKGIKYILIVLRYESSTLYSYSRAEEGKVANEVKDKKREIKVEEFARLR